MARDFYQGSDRLEFLKDTRFNRLNTPIMIVADILGMIIYTCIHSYIITLEMFTLHVAITSSEESVLSFLFYNNFTELKITVFKKVDIPGLY